MKKRYSTQWYNPIRYTHRNIQTYWFQAVFERWVKMRRRQALQEVGCKTFSDVPANLIALLALEYCSSPLQAKHLIEQYY